MPVLPLVGSTTVAPGLSTPRRSASSTIASAMRSLTLPPGIERLHLGQHGGAPRLRNAVEPHERRAADQLQHRAGHSRPRRRADLFWVMGRNPIGNADSRQKNAWQRPSRSDVVHRAARCRRCSSARRRRSSRVSRSITAATPPSSISRHSSARSADVVRRRPAPAAPAASARPSRALHRAQDARPP